LIQIPARLIAGTFAIFRDCGGGRHECVVYLLSSINAPDTIDEVVHPRHTAGYSGYEIDDRWLTDFWFELARRQKSVRIQVHTHPHEAFHSVTDDHWALIHTSGFLSLVIPDYGNGRVWLKDAFLTERTYQGWREIPIDTQLFILTEANL
jgi:hypothetical protein